MSAIKLYGARLSPFVEKTLRGLRLKGFEFELADVSPFALAKINPTTGKMPVAEIEGERVYDSTFILRRLDTLRPDPPLFSEDPALAAAQRQLEDWSDEVLYWYLMALRWTERNAAATVAQMRVFMPAPIRPLAGLFLKRQIGSMPKVQGTGRLPYEVLVRELALAFDDLVALLGTRPFFHGDRVGAADLAVYGELTTGSSGPTPEVPELISDRPKLADLVKRVEDATGGAS